MFQEFLIKQISKKNKIFIVLFIGRFYFILFYFLHLLVATGKSSLR